MASNPIFYNFFQFLMLSEVQGLNLKLCSKQYKICFAPDCGANAKQWPATLFHIDVTFEMRTSVQFRIVYSIDNLFIRGQLLLYQKSKLGERANYRRE